MSDGRDREAETAPDGGREPDGPLAVADLASGVTAVDSDWTLREATYCEHGTDAVYFLTVETPEGDREVVLKARDFLPPERFRAEPHTLRVVGARTDIPVPEVYGVVTDHDRLPTPFFLMERLSGENLEGRDERLDADARRRVVETAGRNLAALHDAVAFDAAGTVDATPAGELHVPDGSDWRTHLTESLTDAATLLEDGEYEHNGDGRFSDLADPVRERVPDLVARVRDPPKLAFLHMDYRLGNLLVDPDTGETNAVLDWGNCLAGDPLLERIATENYLINWAVEEPLAADLRSLYHSSYEGYSKSTHEGIKRQSWDEDSVWVYRLATRLPALCNIDLWMDDASETAKDERAAEHRAFVEEYL